MTVPLKTKESPYLKIRRSVKKQHQQNQRDSPLQDRTLDVFSNSHFQGTLKNYERDQEYEEGENSNDPIIEDSK